MSEPTDSQRLLAALSDGQPHSHKQLYRLGLMAHSRAADLRKQGYTIDVYREGKHYMYRLTGSPSDLQGDTAAASTGVGAAAEQLTLDDAERLGQDAALDPPTPRLAPDARGRRPEWA